MTNVAILAACVLFGSGAMSAETGRDTCLECHVKMTPKGVAAWRGSKHGARNVGCADCHGSDHSTIFALRGQVSAAICGSCHERQRAEFDKSLHAVAVEKMRGDPAFHRFPRDVVDVGCNGCHRIGEVFADGSRGACNSCHSGHAFSVAEARRPEACTQCHTGPDHPHLAMWQASKHGQLFATAETRDQAPTCVTCHMPKGNHHTGMGLTLGQVGSGAVLEGTAAPVPMRTITAAAAKTERMRMVQNCLPCHASRFAAESLSKADEVKKQADALLSEAARLIDELRSKGLLKRPDGEHRPRAESQTHGDAVVPGPDQSYEDLSPIEQRFFDMYKHHHASAFKGAYHHSPEYVHNEGFLRMKQDLNYLKNEADRLRAQSSDRRTPELKAP